MTAPTLAKDERIYRFEIPVDDRFHTVHLHGGPLMVACRRVDVVEFWARSNTSGTAMPRTFLVVGTGHRLPEDLVYRGTALAPGGLVWHLMEQR